MMEQSPLQTVELDRRTTPPLATSHKDDFKNPNAKSPSVFESPRSDVPSVRERRVSIRQANKVEKENVPPPKAPRAKVKPKAKARVK